MREIKSVSVTIEFKKKWFRPKRVLKLDCDPSFEVDIESGFLKLHTIYRNGEVKLFCLKEISGIHQHFVFEGGK